MQNKIIPRIVCLDMLLVTTLTMYFCQPAIAFNNFRDIESNNTWCNTKYEYKRFVPIANMSSDSKIQNMKCRCDPSTFACTVGYNNVYSPYSQTSKLVMIEAHGNKNWYLECNIEMSSNDALAVILNFNLYLGEVDLIKVYNCYTSTYTMLLSRLGITSLKRLIIKSRNTKINLDDNSFGNIDEFYPDLKYLEILSQGITSISPFSFKHFSSLESLKIQQTSIPSLPESLLSNLTSLRTISLFWNRKLMSLPAKLFERNIRLEKIFINKHPRLHNIYEDQFCGLNDLTELDLGANAFSEIPAELFRIRRKSGDCPLKVFRMMGDSCGTNCHRSLPRMLLEPCKNLLSFHYSFNYKQGKGANATISVPRGFVIPISISEIQLNGANLNRGDLTSIVANLQKLEKLDISGNNIEEIKQNDIPLSVKSLTIASNPFLCTCDVIFNLKEFLDTRHCLEDSFLTSLNCSNMKANQNLSLQQYFTSEYEIYDYVYPILREELSIPQAYEYFCSDYLPPTKEKNTITKESVEWDENARLLVIFICAVSFLIFLIFIFASIFAIKKFFASRNVKIEGFNAQIFCKRNEYLSY